MPSSFSSNCAVRLDFVSLTSVFYKETAFFFSFFAYVGFLFLGLRGTRTWASQVLLRRWHL